MVRNNHLFISRDTDMTDLQSTLDKHGDSISYLKIASAQVNLIDIERVCSMVWWSAIAVCVGGGVAERESERQYSFSQRLFGEHKKTFRSLAQQWVTAVELPVSLLDDREITQLAGDYFEKKVIEVGAKTHCSHILNSPSLMREGIEEAQQFGADHIVLEWSLGGNCGIYHPNTAPNILAVHELMEGFTDKTRCIIEAPSQQAQDVWRSIFWQDTHIGNIEDFDQIHSPMSIDFPPDYWDELPNFRKRAQALAESGWVPWDDIARNEDLNLILINNFPWLLSISDPDLEKYIRYLYRTSSGKNRIMQIFQIFG